MSETPKFYTDVHIPHDAVTQLRRKGVDIIHCGDVGLFDVDDLTHLQYAIEHDRIMVSCDRDFESLHAEYLAAGKVHSGIVYFRMNDQCQSIGLIVKELLFLHTAADYREDLYSQFWRVQA